MFDEDTRPWARRRRTIIFSIIGSIAGFFLISTYFTYFYTPPSCFDAKDNGWESGVDCGGRCVRICTHEVIPPKVVWVNSFEIYPGQYNTVAYVENPNQAAGTPEMRYTFTLKNGNRVVAERSGTTVLPPGSVYPIFEGRIFTVDQQPITETEITVEPAEIWQPATVGTDQFRTRDLQLSNADDRPRLDVQLENRTINEAEDVEIVATIFNDEGQPVTASQTIVEEFPASDTRQVTFTWPSPIAKTVRSCIVPTDVALVIDLSGSMNNDNEDPPQPLTDALGAASTFASNLGAQDGLSLITFASEAELELPITNDASLVARWIRNLTIAEGEETGFTNTIEALELADEELNSENHNPDARRVAVILTDGQPTDPDDERAIIEETIALADQLDLKGIEIYAIGLGSEVDRDFIRELASGPENAYFALTGINLAEDLTTVYGNITNAICETGPTKIDVIAKTTANFTPLR